MKYLNFIFIIISIFSYPLNGQDPPTVKIPEGELKGVYLKSRDGRPYSAFMGIPYAETPERFELAMPANSWDGVQDATKFGSVCPQISMVEQKFVGDEACHFINVFTSNIKSKSSVLVFIHGGGFQFGNSDENGADYFMDEDVVLVTFNYRLASLGFLSTGDNVIPGNLGLKDQLLALKWVQKNIKYFGGNPQRVTIFGESAGGASVSYHVLSPQSEGLFRYAICISGTSLNPWAYIENPMQYAHQLADKLSCPKDSKGLKTCLKSKTAKEIVQQVFVKSPLENIVVFAPTIEPTSPSSFLTESPQTLYKEGRFAKIPMVFTANEDEGLLIHAGLIMKDESLREMINENWMDMAPTLFQYDDPKYSKETKDQISKSLRKHYFKGQQISQDTFQNLTDVYSDSYFIYGIRNAAIFHAKHAPAHVAILGYKGTWSQLFALGYTEVLGMTHSDDLQYIFSNERYPKFPEKSQTMMVSKAFVKVFVNFANTGDPNIESMQGWEILSKEEIETGTINWLYFKILPKLSKTPLDKRMRLWDRIYKKLNNNGRGKDEL